MLLRQALSVNGQCPLVEIQGGGPHFVLQPPNKVPDRNGGSLRELRVGNFPIAKGTRMNRGVRPLPQEDNETAFTA